jgi:hypothetical protein
MSVEIACRGDLPSSVQLVPLDGTVYALSFTWADRSEGYFFKVHDETGETLIASGRLTTDSPMFAYRRSRASLPPGALVFIDTTGAGEPPAAEFVRRADGRRVFSSDLGKRVVLAYLTAADLAAA